MTHPSIAVRPAGTVSVLCAVLLVLAPVARPARADDAPGVLDGVAAEVGETRITIAETMEAVRELSALRHLGAEAQAAGLRTLYAEARDALVSRQLILQAYGKSPNKLQPWVLEQRIESLIEERFGGDRSRLLAALGRERITYDDWRRRVEEDLILTSMRRERVDRHVEVAPSDVRAYYATNRAEFALAGPVRVALILLKPVSNETAEATVARAAALRARIASGQDFGALARQHSQDARATTGGDWGFLDPAGELRPELVETLARLRPGECSPPVPTPAGVYLVRKVAEYPDRVLPLADAWSGIETRLRRREADRLQREWIARLRADTFVRVHDLP